MGAWIGSRVRVVAVVIAGLLVVSSAGAGAVRLIGSRDIRDNSIRSIDIRDRTIQTRDLTRNNVRRLRGAQGPRGPAGPQGPAGETYPAEVSVEITPPNPTYGGLNVVDVPASPLNGTGDSRTPLLTFTLDSGAYLMHGTAQFFHFPSGADAVDFGVMHVSIGGVPEPGIAWSPDIPGDGNNAAQLNATGYFTIGAEGTEVVVHGSIRGAGAGQAGAQVVISKVG